jgi:hypothetical protein
MLRLAPARVILWLCVMPRPALLLCLSFALMAAAPRPEEHLGYVPGADYKLADFEDVASYFRKLAATSRRIRLVEFGRSAHGKPLLLAILSSEENLNRLEPFRDISRRLALGLATGEEARRLAREGRAVVWIDSGLHASEVAPVQHSFDLAWRMVTGEDEETRRIRERVILLQVPVINPDGLDWIVHWYRRNVGTPFELAPLPHLYHKYAGHDNNRDWFMLNLEETRHVSRLLFEEWFPQIVYNQHQSPAFPARIFVPPYAEPLNPNIPAAVLEGIHLIGAAMKERFARENKPGVISYHGYDAWWNGGLRSVPAFHNMHGILTETALHAYATPGNYALSDLPERFSHGIPTKLPTVFYPRPWLGGKWSVRDAIDYMLTADMAILELAARNSAQFLLKSWELARASIEAGRQGSPYAYLVPLDARQHDVSAACDMLRRLAWAGVEVHRLRGALSLPSGEYPAGTFVLLAAQPFRPYLVDLMEPQRYPELRTGEAGATRRPYDVAGWTLPYNMGVTVHRVDSPFAASLERVAEIKLPAATAERRQNASFLYIAGRLSANQPVYLDGAGNITSSPPGKGWQLRLPRVGLYLPDTANMDTGWTQYVLDNYRVPYTLLRNQDVRAGIADAQLDSVILASQAPMSILHGNRPADSSPLRGGKLAVLQRPEFSGGIGLEGLARLERFVRDGGTLIAFDSASNLPVQFFPLPLRNYATEPAYYCPGSLIRIRVDNTHPLGAGMPAEAYAFTTGGAAWEITEPEQNREQAAIQSVARFAGANVLASGWLTGERIVANRHILIQARHGNGKVVLFGFRPQFRGQSTGTFKFLLNAIYLASAKPL